MLRIGFDAKRAFLNNTGLGNYSRSVIESLSLYFPGNSYLLYTTKLKDNNRTKGLLNKENISIRTPKSPFLKSWWRSRFVVRQLKKDGVNIYHGLSHELPIGIQKTGIKTVVTIHDLIFLRYPQYYKPADRKIYKLKFRNACKHSDKIIAISEQTKRDIIHFFGTDSSKIEVVYQSCDASFSEKRNEENLSCIKTKYQLPDDFILNVGTIEERKNALLIAKALKQTTSEIKLILIGKETKYAAQLKSFLKQEQLEHRVIFLQNVDFRDLPAIYQLAKVFVYPSAFEGFGIPVLEALYSGTPVIAATGSCLEEAGGPDSIYISPDDETALAKAIDKILNDTALQTKMTEEGKMYASRFTEEAHARNIMKVYESLV
ncbi:glycosyltransferase family 4 protein [Taibaiella lutea]|uniref:Glycosyltransferase family 4 protein n=1 Tax=Taibaiella lutea TaxID=2608001 RepID=A0A5M6CRD4_9BACT|nr:glycosyltransferase family 1 protein [Taibaiella lutea]KAA5536512.1 glycosyltransferase family 4 protein [Taibaiella lutea]